MPPLSTAARTSARSTVHRDADCAASARLRRRSVHWTSARWLRPEERSLPSGHSDRARPRSVARAGSVGKARPLRRGARPIVVARVHHVRVAVPGKSLAEHRVARGRDAHEPERHQRGGRHAMQLTPAKAAFRSSTACARLWLRSGHTGDRQQSADRRWQAKLDQPPSGARAT